MLNMNSNENKELSYGVSCSSNNLSSLNSGGRSNGRTCNTPSNSTLVDNLSTKVVKKLECSITELENKISQDNLKLLEDLKTVVSEQCSGRDIKPILDPIIDSLKEEITKQNCNILNSINKSITSQTDTLNATSITNIAKLESELTKEVQLAKDDLTETVIESKDSVTDKINENQKEIMDLKSLVNDISKQNTCLVNLVNELQSSCANCSCVLSDFLSLLQ